MARGDYGPEIKSSMQQKPPAAKRRSPPGKEPGTGDTPADMARDKARGIPEGSPQDEAIDARNASRGVASVVAAAPGPHPPAPGGNNPAHAAMAASIAHAILGSGKGGY